ncbi:hypothetical protein [Laspinema olomoucense]|uniref:Uncharacterized protein n=1 Tax=Laspinema olomoucense D3b TaxID=2953688 RepID=A0ABT2NE32_9CYAN|nr:hypothetical protein [Laspinema sp. D3b]MCT7980959.1 hypothetical protein [Laspinema sp. D3b]
MVETVENYGEEPGDRSRVAALKPLGINKPFLPHQPLGQKPFKPQFLTPIARKTLTSFELEPAIASSHEETVEEREQFQEEPREEIQELRGIAIATRGGQPLGQWHSIGDRQTQLTLSANPSFQLPLTLSVEEISPNFAELSALTPFATPPLDLGIATTTESMPTAWANLEDLLTQTAEIDTEGEFVLTPWGVQRDNPPEPNRDRSPVPVQNPPDYSDPRSREVTITAPGYGPTPEPEDLEILARKVYDLVKQRLTIERERNGGRYSRRSPW